MFASLSSAIPQVKAGKLKGFAVTGPRALAVDARSADDVRSGAARFRSGGMVRCRGPGRHSEAAVDGLASKATLSSLETKEVKDRLFASGVEIRPASAEAIREAHQVRDGKVGEGREGVGREGGLMACSPFRSA